MLVVFLKGAGSDSSTTQRARRAAAVAAERRRLIREQTPRHGAAAGVRITGTDASPAAQRQARHLMVASLQAAITADARGRIARGELTANPVRNTLCGPLNHGQRTADEDDLRHPLGRYSRLAITHTSRRGDTVSDLGIPFVAVIDFRRGRFTWCKDNPSAPATSKPSWRSYGSRANAQQHAARLRLGLPDQAARILSRRGQ